MTRVLPRRPGFELSAKPITCRPAPKPASEPPPVEIAAAKVVAAIRANLHGTDPDAFNALAYEMMRLDGRL